MPVNRRQRQVVENTLRELRDAAFGDLIPANAEVEQAMEAIQPPANNPTFIPEPAHVFQVPIQVEVERPVDPRPIPAYPIYERQASLINLEELPAVMIIGAGGVGCWIALALALGGVRYMDLFDGDSLSTHNLNRFPLPMSSVGSLKSEALANWLRTLRPEAEIVARGSFDSAIHTRVADWLVCATDSLKSRRMCYDYAQRNGMRYLEVGADGERWTLSPSPPEFSTENEAQPGYQTVPVHVGPCMMAGAAAAYYVLHNQQPSGSHAMNWEKGELLGQWISEVRAVEPEDEVVIEVDENVPVDEMEVEDGQEES